MKADPDLALVEFVPPGRLGLAEYFVTERPSFIRVSEGDLLHALDLRVLDLEPLDFAGNAVDCARAVLEAHFLQLNQLCLITFHSSELGVLLVRTHR